MPKVPANRPAQWGWISLQLRLGLQAASLASFRTELEGVGQGEQQAGAAARIVGRAVAQREGHRQVGPQIATQKQPHAGAGGGECETVGVGKSVIPYRAGIDEAVELI